MKNKPINFREIVNYLLGKKYEVDNQKFRQLLYQYFTCMNDYYDVINTITNIKAYIHKDEKILYVETHRPGLFIGKAGEQINEIQKYIQDTLGYDITIDLRESRLWIGLYNS
ncbi:MAG: hypothetical protein H8E98_03105 [Bacteroidetes bacterium]|nr:hypothetical protein [Bacteroidota bacterium]